MIVQPVVEPMDRFTALVCTIIVAGWRERNLASNYVSICVHLQNFGCSFQMKYSSSHLLTTTGLSREWLHLAGTLLANWNSTSLNLNLVSNEIKSLKGFNLKIVSPGRDPCFHILSTLDGRKFANYF